MKSISAISRILAVIIVLLFAVASAIFAQDMPDLPSPSRPRFAVKTNLLYAVTTFIPNIGFEVGISSRSTIEVSGSYSWIGRTDAASQCHKQRVHLIVRPEYRWWFSERFSGHFVGGHLIYTRYNVSGHKVPLLFKNTNRYDGHGFGVGGVYGYSLPLNRRWGMEFYAGIGYMYMDYDKFGCAKCDRNEVPDRKHYFGPTRVGITLIYMFN